MASMNPFAKSTPAGAPPTATDSIASGSTNQVKAVTVSAKNAIGKTAGAVAGVFRRDKGDDKAPELDADDPLRLDNKPDKVDPEVFVANGQLWESTGDFNKAMESYTKALESVPNHPPALTSIARLHFRQGNLPQAAKTFELAIAQSPQDAGLFNDLGLTLSKMGNHAGAASALERALQLAPGTSRFANNLASVRFDSGDPAAAMKVLAQNNKPAVAHFNMAYLYFKGGQMESARGQINEAMKFESKAAGDVAVGRAIDRSREMLAQINASMGTIATATSQSNSTALAADPTAVQRAVQATSPGAAKPNVTPASSMGPAMAAITPTNSSVTATSPEPAKTADAPSWTQAWNPNYQVKAAANSSAPATATDVSSEKPVAAEPATVAKPKPIRPAAIKPADPTSATTEAPASTKPAATGFMMPE
ncbi:photosystem I assembly protein Ycf3 [Rubripirellula lacrimiformis]|uniref:Photosystem I assembly protein Ycf3 n=2 Tax=Rubripirellula lacrimiformis TaxID=1930273 RepID=A0A517N3I2_9BACT|nr:photosystem I assembly protein Ycf3 [Rubripirellula lacrimiformis]